MNIDYITAVLSDLCMQTEYLLQRVDQEGIDEVNDLDPLLINVRSALHNLHVARLTSNLSQPGRLPNSSRGTAMC